MPFNIDINPWLISAMLSDLNQTADFTARGVREANPIAKPFVQDKSPYGEVALGTLGAMVAGKLPDKPKYKALKALWAAGHTLAGIHNAKEGHGKPNIIFPVVTYKW